MPVFFAILLRECSDAITSPIGRRITLTHLGLSFFAVIVGWPISYTLGEARWAPTLAWWVYAEILMLSYLALAIPADIFEVADEIRPGDWISYGKASPWTVYLAQTLAFVAIMCFWLITALPAFLLGYNLSPVDTGQLVTLAWFAALVHIALAHVSMWIGVAIDTRSYRIAAVDLAYAGLMLGSILIQPLLSTHVSKTFSAQPLEVAARILSITAREALAGSLAGNLAGLSVATTGATPPTQGIPWAMLVTIYGIIIVVTGSLTLLILRQWQGKMKD